MNLIAVWTRMVLRCTSIGMSRLRIITLLPQGVEIKSDLEIAYQRLRRPCLRPGQPGNGNYLCATARAVMPSCY